MLGPSLLFFVTKYKGMSDRNTSRQYVNTLIFTVIAGIVSLLLLAMLWYASETMKQFNALIITIEVGLTAIILLAIIRIIQYERAAYKQQNAGSGMLLDVSSCPDYWTRNNRMCISYFQADDGEKTTYYMAQPSTSTTGTPTLSTLNLDDYNNRTIGDVCDKVSREVKSPWTEVTSVCKSQST